MKEIGKRSGHRIGEVVREVYVPRLFEKYCLSTQRDSRKGAAALAQLTKYLSADQQGIHHFTTGSMCVCVCVYVYVYVWCLLCDPVLLLSRTFAKPMCVQDPVVTGSNHRPSVHHFGEDGSRSQG
jgi:hypothetical protein